VEIEKRDPTLPFRRLIGALLVIIGLAGIVFSIFLDPIQDRPMSFGALQAVGVGLGLLVILGAMVFFKDLGNYPSNLLRTIQLIERPEHRADSSAPFYDSGKLAPGLLEEVRGLVQNRSLVYLLVRSDILTRYNRSVLGLIWTVLDPLLNMVVMAIVFGFLFGRTKPAFPVFLYSGYIIFSFFSQATTASMAELMHGGGRLLGAIYLPRSIFSISVVMSNFVQLLLATVPVVLFMIGYHWPFTPALLFLPISLAIAFGFTLGVGLLVASIAVFFQDFMHFYSALMRLLMYLSGIFYQAADLPGLVGKLIQYSPTYIIVELFRDPIYYGRIPSGMVILTGVLWTIVAMAAGSVIFAQRSKEFTYVV
jgi:ABC-type polysaccharide/polyol phosphate export permease